MRIQFTARLTGVVPFFMPEIHHSKENRPHSGDIYDVLLREDPALRHTRTLMAYLLPNDVSFGRYLLHINFARRLADCSAERSLADPPCSRQSVQTGWYLHPSHAFIAAK